MSNFVLFSVLNLILHLTKADFLSYDGSNCAFVYDADEGAAYPLEVCITDYDKTNTNYPYKSREYICSKTTDGKADIEVYTYYGTNCSRGNEDESRSALGSSHDAYKCGNEGAYTNYDDCFLEYKQYETSNDECSGWVDASYQTKYIVVGSCVSHSGIYQYSRCDPATDSTMVKFVRFTDEECCDLAYTYTGKDEPDWDTYDIKTGCKNQMYIDPDSWICNIAEVANSVDVFTDNQNVECTDIANIFNVNAIILLVIFASVFYF